MPSSKLPPALKILARERNAAADAAILEALPHLVPQVQAEAVAALVDRRHDPALLSLVQMFSRGSESLNQYIAAQVQPLHSAIRTALTSDTFEGRATAVALIVAAVDVRSAYLLAEALHHSCRRTSELAANGLLKLVRCACSSAISFSNPRDIAAFEANCSMLAEALRFAIERWSAHRQAQVLQATLRLFKQLHPVLVEQLAKPNSSLAQDMGQVIASVSDPHVAEALLRSLAVNALRNPAVNAIRSMTSPATIEAVLNAAWLMVHSEMEKACRRLREPADLEPWIEALHRVDTRRIGPAFRIVTAMMPDQRRRTELFHRLLDDPHPSVRQALIWRLIEDESEPATQLLAIAATRADREECILAAREYRHRINVRRRDVPPSTPAMNSSVSAIARAFEELFDRFDSAAPEKLFEFGRLFPTAQDDLPSLLRARFRGHDALDRVKALHIATVLGTLPSLESEVYALTHDPDPMVRAAAVARLIHLPGSTALRILRSSLNDPDPRVQSNAVEVLGRLKAPPPMPSLSEKLQDRNSRVRAAAIQSLLKRSIAEAGAALLEMLQDQSPKHRLGALWVVERLGLKSLQDQVFDISRADPALHVRRRAQRMIRQWSESQVAKFPADAQRSSIRSTLVNPEAR